MTFKEFAQKVNDKFNQLAKGELYSVGSDKMEIWDLYLDSFPAGTNEVLKENREYDCNCCKQFIRGIGAVVGIVDGKIVSVWDVEAEGEYKVVADVLSAYVKGLKIKSVFRHSEKKFGLIKSYDNERAKFWDHFYCTVPSKFLSEDYSSNIADINGTVQVFRRGLEEITKDALEITNELIQQNAVYRGAEFKKGIEGFIKLKDQYSECTQEQKEAFIWENYNKPAARIRNTAIGTLLQDLSEGKDLNTAVASFEAKVAPSNYKRTSAPVTKGMIDKAMKVIDELGIRSALQRRFANINDVSINNLIWSDEAVKDKINDPLKELMLTSVKKSTPKLHKVQDISINDFIANVLPTAEGVELLVENTHVPNFVSLIAPQDPEAKNILKWNNNFSLVYNGGTTDSDIQANVKKAGGNVNGILRFSIQWNDNHDNPDDLDAHCIEPTGHEVYYGDKRSSTSGFLDVDITDPRGVAVENIAYKDLSKMPDGEYEFFVRNFSSRGARSGFKAEIEVNGEVFDYECQAPLKDKQDVHVAVVTLKNGVFSIKHSLKHSTSSKTIWGVKTLEFCKVQMLMKSPNHWDGEETGNKHYMFILDGCNNPDEVRGLFNEFLKPEFNEDRKVFDLLGSKLLCPKSDNQLSGLGFSSTQRNSVVVKVQGASQRMLKINF